MRFPGTVLDQREAWVALTAGPSACRKAAGKRVPGEALANNEPNPAVLYRAPRHRLLECRGQPLGGQPRPFMRNDYLQAARQVISDPNILINVVSRRVKQLKRGARPLVVSLEKLALEDIALREVVEGKITYSLPTEAELAQR